MREIKFRAQGSGGCWRTGSLAVYADGEKVIRSKYGYEHAIAHLSTIGQYTGYKDANGEEIWEGDIVRTTDEDNPQYGRVEFDGCVSAGFGVLFPDSEISDLGFWLSEGIEVVGNIWDNPELLKSSEDAGE